MALQGQEDTIQRGGTVVWFRQDLRVRDNPALTAAVAAGKPVLPVYLWSPEEEGEWAPGSASRWWLHHSLSSLDAALTRLGAPLLIRVGRAEEVLLELVAKSGCDAVYWNRRYEPAAIRRDTELKKKLLAHGLDVQSFNGSLLHEPWQVLTGAETPYKVYTPFSKACFKREVRDPLPSPAQLAPVSSDVSTELHGVPLRDLKLLPKIAWDEGLRATWQPGEEGAHDLLGRFVRDTADEYHEGRNIPGIVGTSRLSPALHFGEISPHQIWRAICEAGPVSGGREVYCREILWREFAHHLLFHFPHTVHEPLRAEFARFPWEPDHRFLTAWQQGKTGYPIVDAGMRELWHTGWMHNRVRMIAASFLIKDLLQPWQAGAAWFWDTLVDADLANNTLGWQWTAGCGADAAPFFRVFNPAGQGERFDAAGTYVSKWCPELAKLPAKWIHRPWEAPPGVLHDAGIRLGAEYPHPIVDHQEMRARALEAYESLKGSKSIGIKSAPGSEAADIHGIAEGLGADPFADTGERAVPLPIRATGGVRRKSRQSVAESEETQ